MNTIQADDWVVLTGEKFKENRLKIKQVSRFFGYSKCDIFFKDDDTCYGVYYDGKGYPGYEIQRIQDYFEPGDEVKFIYKNGDVDIDIVKGWGNGQLYFMHGSLKIDGTWGDIKSIRNLTKEGKMNKEKPTHLTAKELLEKDACEEGFREFVNTFGKSSCVEFSGLKDWFNEHQSYKHWLGRNLPDHYAVIFEPDWQLKKNDYVFIEDTPNDVGRVYCIDDRITVIFHDGKKVEYEKRLVKPISERDFQVGDMVWDKSMLNYKRIGDSADLERANNNKTRFDLIISPAIPEVK